MTTRKPVGILHVKVVRAMNLLKMDLLGASDPYVKLNLTGERLAGRKTEVKWKTLNPEWNENFKFAVKDLSSQILKLQVYDWDKVYILVKSGYRTPAYTSLRLFFSFFQFSLTFLLAVWGT